MTDLRLVILPGGGADIVVENEDAVLDHGLITHILVSLYTDARALEGDELPSAGDDPRGWWAFVFGGLFQGCRLWLLSGKLTAAELLRAEEFAVEALQWMVSEEIATEVTASATRSDSGKLALEIILTRGTADRWEAAWNATAEDIYFHAGNATIHLLSR